MMHHLFNRHLAAVSLLTVGLLPALAAADTCSARHRVCDAYCEKNYANSPHCLAVCRNQTAVCLSTGCWESRVTAKRCGFDRQ
ncbi:MAG TPA: hypothetical protein VKQ73_05125 [Stellaceae bacterium]|nr:hypothetical protein [Stellaceae bacterium]